MKANGQGTGGVSWLSNRNGATRIGPFALVAAAVVGACASEQHRADNMNWTPEPAETSKPREAVEINPPPRATTPEEVAGPRTWVGVRHDLALAPGATKTPCSCLGVHLGDARDAAFKWQDKLPEVGPDATVVAVTSQGVDCPAKPDENQRRPSISAVLQEGNDVVVEIEELPEGRPLASGAIIARPGAGGSVYVRSKSSKLPYGRDPASGRSCKVR